MKKLKSVIATVLAVLMLLLSLPLSAFATTVDDYGDDIVYGSEGNITRAEWLHNLTIVFNMSVESDVMPDNYFSDFDETHEYYEDIMLCINFGVVNIEAGEELKPDELVTRDFAVTTLNFCLAYQSASDDTYTFTDYEQCSSPVDALIAVERGWVNLIDGNFCPNENITSSEVRRMLNDALSIMEKTEIDTNHNNKFEFEEGVIVVPEGSVVAENADGSLSITELSEQIVTGDKFAVYFNGIPSVYTAGTVSTAGNVTTIVPQGEIDINAFTDVDAQGEIDSAEMVITAPEGVELDIEEEQVPINSMRKAAGTKSLKAINATYKIPGGLGTVKAKMKNPLLTYQIDGNGAYVTLEGDTEISYTFSAGAQSAFGLNSITLFTCNVGGIGSFDVTAEVDITGSITGAVKGYLVAGIDWQKGDHIRAVKAFHQAEYSCNAEVTASAGLNVTLGVTKIPFVKAYLYAEIGARAELEIRSYHDDTTPRQCTHFAAYLYAGYGASASVSFLNWSQSESVDYTIFDQNNSPARVVHHYEDGNEVARCTRGTDYSKYFTRYNSRYGGSGWTGAKGTYGLNDAGEPVILYAYELNDMNEATITEYYGNSWSVYIPNEIDGHKIVGIGSYVFENKNVAYVNIPDTVKSIGWAAFADCSNLRSVNIPDGITEIQPSTFESCSSLTEITIPDSVTTIDRYAFCNCISLKNVKLPKTLTFMGDIAFGKTAIEEIEIPKSLDSCSLDGYYLYTLNGEVYNIYCGPFGLCDSLKTVTFETGTTQIANDLFAGCTGLEKIVIPDTVTVIESSAFKDCLRLNEVTIGCSVTTIDNSAFERCVSLPNITIPDSVTTIDRYAFCNCSSLKDVKMPKTLTFMGDIAFGKTAIEEIEIPKSLDSCSLDGYYLYTLNGEEYNIYCGPFGLCDSLKTVTFETGTTQIANDLFAGCTGLEKIVIPDTVTVIESSAFKDCLRLNEVAIGCSVTTIDNSAFERCVSLPNITIPDSVTTIDRYAFCNCISLKNVKLSKALTTMDYEAFGKTAIEEIEIPKSLDSCSLDGYYLYTLNGEEYNIYCGPFGLCDSLKTVTFETGTTQIANDLFAGCTGLEKIVIPDTVTVIESSAFRDCLRLNEVAIGSSVTTIDDSAFMHCVSLPSITIPDNVTEIGSSTFSNCLSLESIKLPNTINYIQQYTFQNCTALKTIEIPDSVTEMSNSVFKNCSSLESIKLSDSLKNIPSSTFYDCTSLKTIEIPSSVTEIGNSAFLGCTALEEAVTSENIRYIRNAAFKNCIVLKTFSVPQSTRFIGDEAFIGCEMLAEVKLADYSITEIANNAFKDCPAITEIVLPKGLKTVRYQAFMNDTGLIKVTVPDSVTSIDSTAFSYPAKTIIYGAAGSYAETFAVNGGFTFVDNRVACEGMAPIEGNEHIILDRGETFRSQFELYPENATDSIVLTASNYCVSIEGMDVHANYSGDTVITATSTNGVTTEYSIHIRQASKIIMMQAPAKTSYLLGENLDTTGAIVNVIYNDSTVKEITDYTVSGFDSSKEGMNTVTVTWFAPDNSEYSTTFTVNIVDPRAKLTGIEIGSLPNKTSYRKRDALDLTGMVVNALYDDNSKVVVTDYTVSGYNALKLGSQLITVTYQGYTATFTITVSDAPAVTLTSINIETMPSKTTYAIGETLDTTGLQLKVNYSDGTVKYVTEGFAISGFSSTTAGEKTVTVTYSGKTVTFTVTVEAAPVTITSVSVNTNPTKTTYNIGETLDTTGLQLKVNYSDGTVKYVTEGFAISGFSSTTAGEKTVTVTYSGKTATFTVTVEAAPVTITSVSVNTNPTKTTYNIGETLDTTGLQLKVNYSDGTVKYVTEGFAVSGFNSATAGEKTVTVTYNGKTTTFTVTVEAAPVTITSVTVNTNPTKTTYYIGEALDTTGLQLKVNYSDGTVKYVTEGFAVSGFNSATAGEKTVAVAYQGHSTQFIVSVIAAPEQESATIEITSARARTGQSVSVDILLKNNPGIAGIVISLEYDTEVFTLVETQKGDIFSSFTAGKNFMWDEGADVTTDGTLATFVFTVADDAQPGDYVIKVIPRDCADVDGNDVVLSPVNGVVTVVDFVYGDATGDEKIDMKDVVLLRKYIVNYDYETETSTVPVEAGSDANGDGEIDMKDVVLLRKYIVNYDYDTETSSIVLGPQ